jgi:hypothetical protein
MHWLSSFLADNRSTGPIVTGAYLFWRRIPWWLAAMRSAVSNDSDKQARALRALRAIEPPRRWPWQRLVEPTAEPDDPGD